MITVVCVVFVLFGLWVRFFYPLAYYLPKLLRILYSFMAARHLLLLFLYYC